MFHADNRIQQEKSARDMWKECHIINYFSVVRPFWVEKDKRQQVCRPTLREDMLEKPDGGRRKKS